MVKARTLSEAYHSSLVKLFYMGDVHPCEWQDQETEMLECSMTMVVLDPLSEPMMSKLWFGGASDLERYRLEMLEGTLDCMIGHGWEYTYHDRMVNFHGINQIDFVVDDLRRNPNSRRAVISLRSDSDMTTDCSDPACLQHIQFTIRDGDLNCFVLFRSNDAPTATFMNAWVLIQLQKMIADRLGVNVGTYTHRANSFHAYKKDWSVLEGFVKRIGSDDKNILMNFKGDFEDWMTEEKPKVDLLIQQVKRNRRI